GMLRHEGEKMSKSLGNLVLVRDLLKVYSGDAIRHYLVSSQYRSEVSYAEADLARSAEAVERLRRASMLAGEGSPADGAVGSPADPARLAPSVEALREAFLA